MKSLLKSSALALSLVTMAATTAWADNAQQILKKQVEEAALECSNGQIFVVLTEQTGVATLYGELDCELGRTAAQKAAMESDSVKKVINLITVSTSK